MKGSRLLNAVCQPFCMRPEKLRTPVRYRSNRQLIGICEGGGEV